MSRIRTNLVGGEEGEDESEAEEGGMRLQRKEPWGWKETRGWKEEDERQNDSIPSNAL